MHGYWRDDLPDAMRGAILADWADELEAWPLESIRAALRKHRRENPSRKPNPGHVLAILKESWGRRNVEATKAALAPPPEEPTHPRMTDERRKEILAELGIRDGSSVSIKRMVDQ